jgi:hypothetical protein
MDDSRTDSAFEYVAWIRDNYLPPDDQDYEWPAVFLIVAANWEEAKAWGDHLAKRRFPPGDDREEFLWSKCEDIRSLGPGGALTHTASDGPVVQAGQDVSDDYIGW